MLFPPSPLFLGHFLHLAPLLPSSTVYYPSATNSCSLESSGWAVQVVGRVGCIGIQKQQRRSKGANSTDQPLCPPTPHTVRPTSSRNSTRPENRFDMSQASPPKYQSASEEEQGLLSDTMSYPPAPLPSSSAGAVSSAVARASTKLWCADHVHFVGQARLLKRREATPSRSCRPCFSSGLVFRSRLKWRTPWFFCPERERCVV